jgi:hypothetical protein
MSRGVRLGIDFGLWQRSKPYVNGKLFFEYIKNIFVLYLNELRDSEEFEACEAVLLMDNYSLHISDDFVAVFTRVRVRVTIFVTHITYVFQMLDVVLFDALKKHATGLEMLDEEQSIAAFLLKVYHDFKQTMVEINIWELLHPLASLVTSSKCHMDSSSMRKSSDKVATSWSSRSAIRPWRVCRNNDESQNLDRLTNQNKLI